MTRSRNKINALRQELNESIDLYGLNAPETLIASQRLDHEIIKAIKKAPIGGDGYEITINESKLIDSE